MSPAVPEEEMRLCLSLGKCRGCDGLVVCVQNQQTLFGEEVFPSTFLRAPGGVGELQLPGTGSEPEGEKRPHPACLGAWPSVAACCKFAQLLPDSLKGFCSPVVLGNVRSLLLLAEEEAALALAASCLAEPNGGPVLHPSIRLAGCLSFLLRNRIESEASVAEHSAARDSCRGR